MGDPPMTALPAWLSQAASSCKGQSSVTPECPQPVTQQGTRGQPLPSPTAGVTDSQGEDLVPQQLRDPHLLPCLLGLTGQPITSHLHIAVHPCWAALGLGLHRHNWAGTGRGSGPQDTLSPVCPLPCPPPHPCQLGVPRLSRVWERGTGSNAPGGSDGWHQALTMPVPSFTPPRVAGLSQPPRTPPCPRARRQEGTGHPQAGRACGGAELDVARRGHSSGCREPSRGRGSSSSAPAGPRSHVPTAAEPSPRHTGQRRPCPAPAPPGVSRVLSAGCRHGTHDTLLARGRGNPSEAAGPTFHGERGLLAGQPGPGPAGAGSGHGITPGWKQREETPQHGSHGTRGTQHSPMVLRVPRTAGTWGKGWAILGTHRLPLVINQPWTKGHAVSLGEQPPHGSARG